MLASRPARAAPPECSNSQEGCWPLLYLIGAQKAATTSLFDLLRSRGLTCGAKHSSDTFKPSGRFFSRKEVHLFDANRTEFSWVLNSPQQYTRLYQSSDCTSGRFIDATPCLHTWEAPRRMLQLVPKRWMRESRFLAVLREPVARDLSWYNHRLAEHGWQFCAHSPNGNGAGVGPTFAAEVSCSLSQFADCTGMSLPSTVTREDGRLADLAKAFVLEPFTANTMSTTYAKCMERGEGRAGELANGLYAMHASESMLSSASQNPAGRCGLAAPQCCTVP